MLRSIARVVFLCVFLPFDVGLAAEPTQFPVSSDHMWNRLHEQLYVRTRTDGSRYVHESVDANFTPRAKFLIEGDSHRQALALLDEFLQPGAVHLKDDLARAILQRDLWAVFAAVGDPDFPHQVERKELRQRLVKAMKQIALPAGQIEKLPDNFAAVARGEQYPADFDAREPDKPFLPRNLFADDGPWVLLTNRFRPDASTAPQHDKATQGRSTFLMFLRLPTGRAATLEYLKELGTKHIGMEEMPQIPSDTQVALLRRSNLIDEAGNIHVSPLTDSLQLRVYHDLRKPNVFEFNLRRRPLFDEPSRSLQPVARDEINHFDLGLLGLVPRKEDDVIENPPRDPDRRGFGRFVMQSCVRCHAGPGIFGFQSLYVDHFEQPPLAAGILKDQIAAATKRAQNGASVPGLQIMWSAN